jgi:hypothetical protein
MEFNCGITHILWEGGFVRNKRLMFGDRRQGKPMPRVPFKDSDGATIKENRRKIPDRRAGNIQVNWSDMRS